MYYHGSKTSGIKKLIPNVSSHNESYVYLTTNKAVALIYTVNAIESHYEKQGMQKPDSFQPWYSYGFNSKKVPCIEEYYPNATIDTYKGKKGFIYVCEEPIDYHNPTNIYCAITTEVPVRVVKEIVIEDVYEEMLSLEAMGELIIHYYSHSNIDRLNIEKVIKEEINRLDLKNQPNNNYTVFLKDKFPHYFE